MVKLLFPDSSVTTVSTSGMQEHFAIHVALCVNWSPKYFLMNTFSLLCVSSSWQPRRSNSSGTGAAGPGPARHSGSSAAAPYCLPFRLLGGSRVGGGGSFSRQWMNGRRRVQQNLLSLKSLFIYWAQGRVSCSPGTGSV